MAGWITRTFKRAEKVEPSAEWLPDPEGEWAGDRLVIEAADPMAGGGRCGLLFLGIVFSMGLIITASKGVNPVVIGVMGALTLSTWILFGLAVRQAGRTKAVIELPKDRLMPGDAVEATWRVQGDTHKIGQWTIGLLCREQVTYTRGTDTVTEDKTIHEESLVDLPTLGSTRKIAGETGTFSMSVPRHAMHSFESDNNKVIWSLELRGVLKWWPDLKRRAVFSVVPLGWSEATYEADALRAEEAESAEEMAFSSGREVT